MATEDVRFLCGLVAGGCVVAAVWLRWDLAERAVAWYADDLKTTNGIVNAIYGMIVGLLIALIASGVIIIVAKTL